MVRRILPGLGLLVVLPLAGCGGGTEEPPKVGLNVGNMAPDLEGIDVNGRTVKLSSYRGQVVLVDFWATWCGPCKELIPYEKKMLRTFKDKPFAILGVSADHSPAALKEFQEKEELPWTNIYDGSPGPIAQAWGVDRYPTLFLIDAKGVIRGANVDDRGLERLIRSLLKEMEDKGAAS